MNQALVAGEAAVHGDEVPRIVDRFSAGMAVVDLGGTILRVNRKLAHLMGYTVAELSAEGGKEAFGRFCAALGGPDFWEKIRSGKPSWQREVPLIRTDGKEGVVVADGALLSGKSRQHPLLIVTVKDVSRRIAGKDRQEQDKAALESRCIALERELATRMREMEGLNSELKDARASAMKVDMAAKALISRITDQKREIQELIAQNMGLTVFPLLEYMRSTAPSEALQHLIDSLEFNLKHIASRFGIGLGDSRYRLSPREIQICRMISKGKDSQQIAKAFGLAPQTVSVHRKNIRKKLGLKKVKQTLASFIRENM